MNVEQTVNDFIRDAQYKCAVLQQEMDDLDDQGSYEYWDRFYMILQLEAFLSVVYEGGFALVKSENGAIVDTSPYNLLYGEMTDYQIVNECQKLRDITSMAEVPYLEFTNYYPQIVSGQNSVVTGNSVEGAVFPTGTEGQYLTYDASATVVASSFPTFAGSSDGESIPDYFATP